MISFDWSMSSPAMTIDCGTHFEIHYVNGNAKVCTDFQVGNIHVFGHWYDHKKEGHSEIERFNNIRNIMITALLASPLLADAEKTAVFESYSFGSKGRIAQIAENTGIMKSALVSLGYKIETMAPTSIKKYASGTGKADKDVMAEAWFKEFNWHVHDQISDKQKMGHSPSADIIDSYYVMKAFRMKRLEESVSDLAKDIVQ